MPGGSAGRDPARRRELAQRRSANKPNPVAEKWAENMTDQFAALASAEPVFGELRNCMELAIVGALLVKERLPEKVAFFIMFL